MSNYSKALEEMKRRRQEEAEQKTAPSSLLSKAQPEKKDYSKALELMRRQREYNDKMATVNVQRAKRQQEWINTRTQDVIKADIDRVQKQIDKAQRPVTAQKLIWLGNAAVSGITGNQVAVDNQRDVLDQTAAKADKETEPYRIELEKYQNELARRQAYDFQQKYGELPKEKDFRSKSQYIEELGKKDTRYAHINDKLDDVNKLKYVWDLRTSPLSDYSSSAQFIDEEELAIFNYLYATQGADEAYEYYDAIESGLNKEWTEAINQDMAKIAEKSAIGGSALSVATGLARGYGYVGQLGDVLRGKEIDPNASYNIFSNMTGTLRDTVSKDWGPVGSFAYDTGMSMADFLAAAAASLGSGFASLILGTGAASDATIDALERGVSSNRAFFIGTAAGAIEVATEKMSIDELFKNPTKEGIKQYVKQNIKSEATEEAISEIANTLADAVIAGDKSNWIIATNEYKMKGYSESEALARVIADKLGETGLAALGGALSGGVMAGGGVAISEGHAAIGKAAADTSSKLRGQEVLRGAQNSKESQQQRDAQQKFTVLPTAVEQERAKARERGEVFDVGYERPYTGYANTAADDELDSRVNAAQTVTEKTGIRYGASEKQISDALELSKALGRDVEFFNQKSADGKPVVDGFYSNENGHIYLNVNAVKKLETTISHELVHSFEGTPIYDELETYVMLEYERRGKSFDAEVAQLTKTYEDAGRYQGEEAIKHDMVANFVEKYVLGSKRSIKEITKSKPSVARRMLAWLSNVLKKLERTSVSVDVFDEIEKIINEFDDAEVSSAEEAPTNVGEENVATATENEVNADEEVVAENKTPATEASERSQGKAEKETAVPKETKKASERETAKTTVKESVRIAEADDMLAEAEAAYDAGEITAEELDATREVYDLWYETGTKPSESGSGWNDGKIARSVKRLLGDKLEYSISVAPDGKQYVKADRIVIFGNDPESWAAQIEDYINNKIRHGENVVLTAADGDALILTEDTAGKASFRNLIKYDGKLRPMTDSEYETKINAETHIDELVKVSTRGDKIIADEGGIHGDMAKDGWNYRRAFFMDFDGKYYSLNISVAIGSQGKIVYNIANIRKRSFPISKGSSAKSGAQDEKTSYNTTISHSVSSVNSENEDVTQMQQLEREADVLEENGVDVIDGSVIKYSVSSWTDKEKETVRSKLLKVFDKETVDTWIEDVSSVAAIILSDRNRLDFEAADNQAFLKKNEEYKYTLDSSTLCSKRLLYQGTFDAIQHALPDHVFTSDQLLDLLNIMDKAGYITPCGVCYVESRRRHLPKYAQRWLDTYDGEYIPQLDEITTTDGREKLRKEHPQTYADFIKAMKKIGVNNPKVVELRTDYRGDIRKLGKSTIAWLIKNGGLRIQSFSDFETPHLLDMMQAVLDMAAVELSSQAYTKVPDFAWVFGDTGIKINLSLIAEGNGFDADGNLAFSSKQGMDFDEAMALRNAYSANVGTIIVGANDAHILACMADDRIDFIIPFHKSGWGNKELALMGMKSYTDYTEEQNERYIETGSNVSENIKPLSYWDFDADGKTNAETYLKLCAEEGMIPKFSRFLVDNGDGSYSLQPDGSTDGYWKTLIDFKMYDNDGVGSPQVAVKPNFNMEEAVRVLSEYEGGANTLPVANDIVDEFVKKYKSGIQYSVSETDAVEGVDVVASLPSKAKSALRTVERKIGISMAEALNLDLGGESGKYQTQEFRNFLADVVRPLTEEYLETGEISSAAVRNMFEDNYEDIPGMPKSMYTTQKANDLSAFEKAINDNWNELRNIRRYAEDAKREKVMRVTTPITTAEAKERFKALKDAQRFEAKVVRNNLLTEEDNLKVGELLRGETIIGNLTDGKYNIDGIKAVYEAKLQTKEAADAVSKYKRQVAASRRENAESMLEGSDKWKDKGNGFAYARETIERNIVDVTNDKATADKLIREIAYPVHESEAKSTKWKDEMKARVKALNLSTKVKKGNTVSESYAVQFYGEASENIKIIESSRGRIDKRDGYTAEEWKAALEAMWQENPNLDKAKIERAVEEFRSIYEEIFEIMNDVRIRNGYAPVEYRKGYFPHFTGDEEGVLAKFGRALGIKTEMMKLPTTINGMTGTFKPGITWFGHAQSRQGIYTTYDAVTGFEQYINGAADVIFHTDNIQNLRALATMIRYNASEESIKAKIVDVLSDDALDDAAKEAVLADIRSNGKYRLSQFVSYLDEYTNLLANKKSKLDRGVEELFGRKIYVVVKNLESKVAANMVALNLGSALTNYIPINQAGAQLGWRWILQGMGQTVSNYAKADGIDDISTFIINRHGSDPLVRTFLEKASDVASKPMELVDNFTTGTIVRAAYAKYLHSGMTETEAMYQADLFAASVMADRSKGSMPTIFSSKNPLTKLFTQFQLEVNNEFSVIFKDIPRREREKWTDAVAIVLMKYFFGAFLYNELYERIVGRRAAFDPIGIIKGAYEDFKRGDSFGDVTKEALTEIGGNLPFVGGVLFEGGRIPISSALPDVETLLKASLSDWSAEKKRKTIGKELLAPLYYIAFPFGGGAVKKLNESISIIKNGGRYTFDSEGNRMLQYPFYKGEGFSTFKEGAKALMFGGTSTEAGREWVESDFGKLGAIETATYQSLIEAGMSSRKAHDFINDMREIEAPGVETKTENYEYLGIKVQHEVPVDPDAEVKTKAQLKREMLENSDLTGEQKSIVYFALMASDLEQVLMTELEGLGADMGEATDVLLNMKDAANTYEKMEILLNSDLRSNAKEWIYTDRISESRIEDIEAFAEADMDFDTFIRANMEYNRIYNEDLSASEKATALARWINQNGFDAEEKAVIEEAFKYYSMMPAKAGKYDDFTESGLDDETAYKLSSALADLEPLEGKTSVSELQKCRAVIDTIGSPTEQMKALESVMNKSNYKKCVTAGSYGVDAETYVAFREALEAGDKDGNGSISQAEAEAALDKLSGNLSDGERWLIELTGGSMPGVVYLSNTQLAVLWQLANPSWNPKNNPYSKSVGQTVQDLIK